MIGMNKEKRKVEPNDFPAPHVGMHAPREYSNPFAPRNAYACGRAKGAVDQSLARVFLRDSRENTIVFPSDILTFPPASMYNTCAYTCCAYVLAHERIQGVS